MTKQEAIQLLAAIRAAYPQAFNKGADGLELTVEIWAAALNEVSYSMAQRGLIDHVKANKWPPTIAEITEAARQYDPERNLLLLAAGRQSRICPAAQNTLKEAGK